jgi:hypothetical protein
MENWKSDLDALISETMAFVASIHVAGSSVPVSMPVQSTAPMPTPPPVRDEQSEPWAKTEREEIAGRVASFKAHQERWIREREDYANSILKGIAR